MILGDFTLEMNPTSLDSYTKWFKHRILDAHVQEKEAFNDSNVSI